MFIQRVKCSFDDEDGLDDLVKKGEGGFERDFEAGLVGEPWGEEVGDGVAREGRVRDLSRLEI